MATVRTARRLGMLGLAGLLIGCGGDPGVRAGAAAPGGYGVQVIRSAGCLPRCDRTFVVGSVNWARCRTRCGRPTQPFH